jgi:tripartite-type tricarboxylate transporter receptor subunit TctC
MTCKPAASASANKLWRVIGATLFAAALPATGPALAQSPADYPSKPVKIIVNVAPGGGVDTATRIIADKLHARLGQPFVVENRPGAGGNIGAEAVFQSEGDGYTLLASSPSPLAINGWLYKKLSFDPAGFEPVAMMSRIPNVLVVRPDFPAKTVEGLVAFAKANPGKLNYGSQGIGTASHLTGELFMTLTGTKLVHVPYKGSTSGVLTDVIAGHLDLSFIQFSAVHQLQHSGKLRVLAVATAQRLEILPEVPTMAEAGYPDVVSETWNAISAPPRTPAPIVLKLNAAVDAALLNRMCSPASATCRCWSAAATPHRPDGSSNSSARSGAR